MNNHASCDSLNGLTSHVFIGILSRWLVQHHFVQFDPVITGFQAVHP